MGELLDLGGYVIAQLQRDRQDITTFGNAEPQYAYGPTTGVRLFCGLGMLDLTAEQVTRLAAFVERG